MNTLTMIRQTAPKCMGVDLASDVSLSADAAHNVGRANPAAEPVPKVSRTPLDICQQIADYHLAQLSAALAAHGYHDAVTDAHGYQFLGAVRCVEALRIAAKGKA